MPFRILSIDGGGLRGIIPLVMLEHLLKITGRPSVAESFDLIAGTSTGGIIACALSLKTNGQPTFSIEDIKGIYTRYGAAIFPVPWLGIKSLFAPKYNTKGLEEVLHKYFGQHTLQDCKTPVFISAYDVNNYNTFYYSSRFINPTSAGSMGNTQFRVADICRSTSAAPTYFASHHFSFLNDHTQSQSTHNLVDGGVYLNNPALAAVTEVLEHRRDPLYTCDRPIALEDIFVLSLGTGFSAKTITPSQGRNWGQIKWARNLFEIMMQGNSQSVHKQMKVLFDESHYLRLNILIPPDAAEMDDATEATRQKLIGEVYSAIINNSVTQDNITRFCKHAGL
jgi:uncharacterized protein